MMIDITNEELIQLSKVPQHMPKRANGKKIHVSAVYRWINRGLRGVRLEVIRIGGTSYTSKEALQRFAERLTGPQSPSPNSRVATKSRQKKIDQAAKKVKEIMEKNPQ